MANQSLQYPQTATHYSHEQRSEHSTISSFYVTSGLQSSICATCLAISLTLITTCMQWVTAVTSHFSVCTSVHLFVCLSTLGVVDHMLIMCGWSSLSLRYYPHINSHHTLFEIGLPYKVGESSRIVKKIGSE